jgi:hypothetical protein
MKGFIRPQTLEGRPPYVALGLEWPWEVLANTSDETRVQIETSTWPLVDADLRISNYANTGAIRFRVSTPGWETEYEITFLNGLMSYQSIGDEISVVTQRTQYNFSEFLNKHGLTILLEQDATIVPPGLLLKPNRDLPPFEIDTAILLDWSKINIRKESQGPNCDADSIQAAVIEYMKGLLDWDLIIDDDGSGEIADIVAFKVDGEFLILSLVHCKYSSENFPGGRIEDLYEVCGQAEKSVAWRKNMDKLFSNLIRRERNRWANHNRSGIMVGSPKKLFDLEERARLLKPSLSIYIAQPGVSKNRISSQQLELLGSTEVYLREVANANFYVICSS